mgnify:FL=1
METNWIDSIFSDNVDLPISSIVPDNVSYGSINRLNAPQADYMDAPYVPQTNNYRQNIDPIPYNLGTPTLQLIGETARGQIDIVEGTLRNIFAEPDLDFNPLDHKKNVHPADWPNLVDAQNEQHFNWLNEASQRDRYRGESYNNSSWGSYIASVPFDALNAVPMIRAFKASTTLARVGDAALTGGVITTGEEFFRHGSGINATVERSVQNVAAATLFSGVLGGAIDVGIKAHDNFIVDNLRNFRGRTAQISVMEDLQARKGNYEVEQRALRGFDHFDDIDIDRQIIHLDQVVVGLNKGIKKNSQLLDSGKLDPIEEKKVNNILKNLSSRLDSTHTEQRGLVKEAADRMIDKVTFEGEVDPWKLAHGTWNPIPSPFSDVMKLNPIKNELTGEKIYSGLNVLKDSVMRIASDNGRLNLANIAGYSNPSSVVTKASTYKMYWVQYQRIMHEAYGEHYSVNDFTLFGMNPTSSYRKVFGQQGTKLQFATEARRKRIFGEEASSPAEQKLMDAESHFYEYMQSQLNDNNLIGNRSPVEQGIYSSNSEIAIARSKLNDPDNKMTPDTREYLTNRVEELEKHVAILKSSQAVIESGNIKGQVREPFMNRIYDTAKMMKNPDGIKKIFFNWFKESGSVMIYNPKTMLFEKVSTSGLSDAKLMSIVDDSYQKILDDVDPFDSGVGETMGDTIRLAHRMIDIPNSRIFDYIHTDPLMTMQNYTQRVGAKLAWSEVFDGKTPDQVWNGVEMQLRLDGYDNAFIDAARVNWGTLKDRVMGTVYRDPSARGLKIATVWKEITSLAYLDTSGAASFGDFARTVMDHELGDTLMMLTRMFRSPEMRETMRETRSEFSEGVDLDHGSIIQQLEASGLTNIDARSTWNQIKQAGHIMNGLGPITELFKTFEGSIRVHTLLKYAKRHVDGTATKYESIYMARYGISMKMMREIVNIAPTQDSGGQKLANIMFWEQAGVSRETIQTFREAVNSGVMNTVLSATPADRPRIADGIVYIPRRVADKIPWASNIPDDVKYKGYVRIESGLMTLPFQFYSYMFASMNKTTAALTSGAVLNRVSGSMAAIGLGYLSIMAKTPEYIWEQMEDRDKLLRAIDYSGLGSLYATLAYDSMQQQLAAGYDPTLSDHMAPKFQQEKSYSDFLIGFSGAGTSVAKDVATGVYDVATGETQSGLQMLYNIAPLTGTYPVKLIVGQMTDVLGGGSYEKR